MVITANVYVEHPDLALTRTITSLPDVDIGVVSDAGTDPEHRGSFFWFEARDYETVESALAADHTVEAFSVIVETETRRTYRITYAADALLLSPTIIDCGGLTIDARSHDSGWLLELQLQHNETLHELSEFASEKDLLFDVVEIQQGSETDLTSELGLTEPQMEALVCAYANGYYDEPRTISLEELGSILGISQTAVSGRLRRGGARLAEAALFGDRDD